MPRKKEITRNTTYEKLINIGKASEKAISNLKIEDYYNNEMFSTQNL